MIKLLDKTTIDKIAAGEVIERPSSVVKELLENSIDAGATAVTVEIKDGGMSFIRVTDNGCGIPKDEVKTAYLRHATSKIETAEDLSTVASLGFRGEALSTIAAVSQCEMVTKTAEEMTGVKYVIHGGTEIENKEVGVPDGTTIVVRNLFYNTPARKKFLKTPMTEGSYVADLVLRLALSHPEIAFKLIVNGQTKVSTSGNGKIKDNIYEIFGLDITSNLIEINCKSDNISLSGYIGKPFIARGNRGLENYFVNNRYIKSNIVNRAIEEGYKTFVMQHKFPFTVLYIDLPVEQCDVNVHPTKMEFKYDNERELFEFISKQIRDALSGKEIIPKDISEENTLEKENKSEAKGVRPAEPFEQERRLQTIPKADSRVGMYSKPSYKILENLKQQEKASENPAIKNNIKETYNSHGIINSQPINSGDEINYAEQIEKTLVKEEGVKYISSAEEDKAKESEQDKSSGKQTSMFDDDFLTEKARKKHRLIGQLFGTYWLIEYEKNLYIMDQHAAHEKVKFEELMAGLKDRETYSQQLLPPMIITVSYAERQAILNHYDLFMKTGYDIEEFGVNEFKINAVPSNIYGIHERAMFMEFVSSLINNSGYMTDDIFVKKLSTMACKAAVKGNMQLSFAEAEALIDRLLSLENPYTCPHGRPTIISISISELEKKFKRVI